MNWDRIQGRFKQVRGSMRQGWGVAIGSENSELAGKRERFEGMLQEIAGCLRERQKNGAPASDSPLMATGGRAHN